MHPCSEASLHLSTRRSAAPNCAAEMQLRRNARHLAATSPAPVGRPLASLPCFLIIAVISVEHLSLHIEFGFLLTRRA